MKLREHAGNILYATDRGIGKVSGMEVSQKTCRFGLEEFRPRGVDKACPV